MTAQTTAQPLLAVENLNVRFTGARGPHHAVKDLSFRLDRGQTLAVVGESGSGKSTAALALLRLTASDAAIGGRILFEGHDLLALPLDAMRQRRGRDVSMIFQEPMTSLNPVHTVGRQIGEVLRLHEGLSAAAARRRTLDLLDLVRIPEPGRRIDVHPHQLSGGQRQRVMIAMAVACQPRLLVADEPTTALDVATQKQILDLLDGLRRDLSMALLLVTHDLGVVKDRADHVLVMHDGAKLEEGDTATLFERPRHAYTRCLLAASLHNGDTPHCSERRLPEIRIGRDAVTGTRSFTLEVPPVHPRRTPPQTEPLLSVRDLRTDYRTADGLVSAVDGVSFDIAPGESVGLVGQSGCGKSTLAKTVMRLVPASGGRILLDGTDLAQLPERALKPWRRRFQMVFQDPYGSLNPRHTVQDSLDAALIVHGVRERGERAVRIKAMLDRVGLPADSAQRYPNEFSGGQRQRIGIARALLLKPSLVVCDEPVSALDVSVQAQILNLLVELKEEFNLAYLFISHDLAAVRHIADRVLGMKAGRLLAPENALGG
ncbi:peptide/nickel transport system ATP-binding protein [Azospirillum baldaniorum]|uniref:ABC transporter ATP-binding protein n=1 Tax=Azospirillum baldaniorum TaxID=1064539 RepID=UPI00119E47E5|nr:ABC transporter ATP-binding protein [Azospirillum baldaniorum]TWA57367.1 peptide/nickel transport system ATP-binding protein [Azospirillum baldaniorum]